MHRAGFIGEGEQGPRPGPPRLRRPRGTSARGPEPCEDPAGRGLSAGNRAQKGNPRTAAFLACD